MISLDDKIEEYQKWYFSLLIEYEPIITEYIIIPTTYDTIFHSTNHVYLRNILICILILRRFIMIENLPNILYLIIPVLSYLSTSDINIKAMIYSCVYSNNIFEGAFIGINTTLISIYYPINYAYFFHILYVCLRNMFSFKMIHINDKITSLEIRYTPKKHLNFKERLSENLEGIELYINTIFEPMKQII
jgi:hypothetical protein